MKKSYYKIIPILFLFFTITTYSQGNRMNQKVQKAKVSGEKFTTISKVLNSIEKRKSEQKYFINPDDVFFFNYEKNEILNTDKRHITISIPLDNKNMELDLIEVAESFYDIEVSTSSKKTFVLNEKSKHYRGVIKGNANSIVAISFYENDIMGIIANQYGNYNLGKIKDTNNYIFYNDINLLKKSEFNCSTESDDTKYHDPNVDLKNNKNFNKTDSKCIQVYYETEYDIYTTKGGIANVVKYILALHNEVSALYEIEEVEIYRSHLKIWDTEDPYDAGDVGTLLSQFKNLTNSINGNVGQLLSFENGQEGGGAAASTLFGLCNTVDNSLSVANIDASFVDIPIFSESVQVMTHEIGHTLGSYHTHDCKWGIAGDTQIDDCGNILSPPQPNTGSCYAPNSPIIPNFGTIMSYCALPNSGGSSGVSFSLGFGTEPGDRIRATILAATCLANDCDFLCVLNSPSNLSSLNIGHDTADISWSAVNNSNGYQSQYREYGTGTGTWLDASIDNPNTTITITSGLQELTTYEWQVRTKCDNDINAYGSWSSSATFTTLEECILDDTIYDIVNNTQVIEVSDFIISYSNIQNGADITYSAGNRILLKAINDGPAVFNFKVEAGSKFLAKIEGCSVTSNRVSNTNDYNENIEDYKEPELTEEKIEIIKLYPNPTNGKVTIESTKDMLQWELYNPFGRTINKNELDSNTSKKVEVDLNNAPIGLYFIKITLNTGEQIIKRIIKK